MKTDKNKKIYALESLESCMDIKLFSHYMWYGSFICYLKVIYHIIMEFKVDKPIN